MKDDGMITCLSSFCLYSPDAVLARTERKGMSAIRRCPLSPRSVVIFMPARSISRRWEIARTISSCRRLSISGVMLLRSILMATLRRDLAICALGALFLKRESNQLMRHLRHWDHETNLACA